MSHGGRATAPAAVPATGSDGDEESGGGADTSGGIVIGPVSQGAIGHSASPVRAPAPGPAATADGGGSRCRPVSARGDLDGVLRSASKLTTERFSHGF
jgi:hypothetical protein